GLSSCPWHPPKSILGTSLHAQVSHFCYRCFSVLRTKRTFCADCLNVDPKRAPSRSIAGTVQASILCRKILGPLPRQLGTHTRAGRVELAQRRNGDGFDYICQKRRVIEPPEAPMMMRGRMTVLNYDISRASLINLGKFIHGKFISGLPNNTNLDKWADYAKRNSYGDNKRQCRGQLARAGRHDAEND